MYNSYHVNFLKRIHGIVNNLHNEIRWQEIEKKQVATIMVATARIAAAAHINPSYSPDGTNVHIRLVHGSMGPCESVAKRHADKFSGFCTAHGCI